VGDVIRSGMAGASDFAAAVGGATSSKRDLRARKRFYRLPACG
jgi:hypothetical protein